LIEAKLAGQQAVVSAPAPTILPLPEAFKKSVGTQNESKRGTTEDGRTAFTIGAFFRVPTGEAVGTQREIVAPIVNTSRC